METLPDDFVLPVVKSTLSKYAVHDLFLKQAIRDHLLGNLSYCLLTNCIFDQYGNWINGYFMSMTGKIKARIIAEEYLIFCFDDECKQKFQPFNDCQSC